jgi:sugar phosphate permease
MKSNQDASVAEDSNLEIPKTEKRTKTRWYVLFLTCSMYLLTYMDRVNISAAAPVIRQEFGFDKITMGIIFSMFTWGYALCQVPGGWLGDKFGPKKVLATIVTYWSLMTAATAWCTGLVSFAIVRFLFGVGEAGAFPTATRAMQMWYNRAERGIVQGVTHSASRLGAAIVPPITVAMIAAWGWHSVFYIFGGVGVLWSGLWYLTYKNTPEENKGTNKAELAHIRGLDENGDIRKLDLQARPKVPWKVLLKHPNMWAIMCAYFAYNYNLWIFLSWMPTYLVDHRGFTLVKMGIFASLPLLAGVVGDTVGGWASDKILEKTGNTKLARRSVAIVGMSGAAIFMLATAMSTSAYGSVACLTAAMFFLECIIGPAWAVPMDVGGPYSGTVSGMMNMAGNTGGAISPLVFGVCVTYWTWDTPFFVAAGVLTVGACIWAFWLNPEVSVVHKGAVVVQHEK